MRILYFYQYFTIPEGSYSTRVYEFARRWAKAGDSVTVVTSVYDRSGISPKGAIARFNIDGIDVRMINIRLSNGHSKAFRILTFIGYAVIACWYSLVLPADVVIASSGPLTVGIPAMVARYLRRKPLVFEVRDLWPEGAIQLGVLRHRAAIWLARSLERACYRAAARIVALSEGMADWIRANHGIDHIDVVPNASDNELVAGLEGRPFELPDWAIGKQVAVYAGALGLIDDCTQVLEVAKILQERGSDHVQFVIIGSGMEGNHLRHLASEMDLRNLKFLGPLPKETVMRWLGVAACSLFTVKNVPFLATASPNKVFDAFAAGTPVIQSTEGWIGRLFEREQCGINVKPGDMEAMADAVVKLADDSDLRRRLGANSRRIARDTFDRTLLAGKMRSVLACASDRSLRDRAGLTSVARRLP
jgi:glycosyltransferase involved in cell wall biosynthesis